MNLPDGEATKGSVKHGEPLSDPIHPEQATGNNCTSLLERIAEKDKQIKELKLLLLDVSRYPHDEGIRKNADSIEILLKTLFKVGSFVCSNKGIIYEVKHLVAKHHFNLTCVYDDSYHASMAISLFRPAADEDWIVENNGVTWNASQDRHGWIWLYADGRLFIAHELAVYGGKDYRNKIAKQMCVALSVPIKPFNEKEEEDV